MSSNFEKFKELNLGKDLLILPNAWDIKSALLFQEKGFPAVATSSAAVAAGLGYEDGEGMPLADYLFVIKRILSRVSVPLTVDFEMGYGKTNEQIAANVQQLAGLGVAGINIEDSVIEGSRRSLQDAAAFAKTIAYIKDHLSENNSDIFINLRCDTYLLNVAGKQEETTRRLALYQNCGADAVFLPGISDEKDIAEAVNNSGLPINVMCIPGLPGFDRLQELGVKRASMGPFIFNKVYKYAEALCEQVAEKKSFAPIL